MKLKDNIKKVLLIFPPSTSPSFFEPMVSVPMGIAYLASSARRAGYEVSCLDAVVEAPHQEEKVSPQISRVGLTIEQIMGRIEAGRPDLIGLSCIFSNQWPAVRELARRIKSLDPSIPVVTGGTHPSFMTERCMADAPVDFVVKGEGEATFVELLNRLKRGAEISDLDGLGYRSDGRVMVNPQTRLIEDLDKLPFPAHDLFPVAKYFKLALPMAYAFLSPKSLPIVTSRGCTCKCTFCSSTNHWGRYRMRSPENVLAEMDWLVERFGIEEIKFQDDNFSLNRARTKEILERMIERPYHLHWNTPNGIAIWTLDDEILGLMKKSGCYALIFAVESGNQEVLTKLIRKPLRLEKVEEVVALAKKHGIGCGSYFIIGFPGETMEQIRSTVRFSRKLRLHHVTIFLYNPLPGSEMYETCLHLGYITEDDFFESGNQYFLSKISSPEWDPKTLERIARWEWFRNYFRFLNGPTVVARIYLSYIRNRPDFLRFAVKRTLRLLSIKGGGANRPPA